LARARTGAPRLITLTTDYGTRDAYLAELKGSLLSEGPPGLRLVDLSHDLTPFDVFGAAWFLRRALPGFPPCTIHLVVVDPGVGSARAPLMVRVGDQLLVGPDNGVFGLLYDGREQVFAIDLRRFEGRRVSSTFHGRDLFAPVAARLAAGARCEDLGAPVSAYERVVLPAPVRGAAGIEGQILHVDHFGNLVTNIEAALAESLAPRGELRFRSSGVQVDGLRDHYAEVAAGELLALVGSSGFVELAVREGSAAARLSAARGAPVTVTKRS
jgi:S-adenosylmethionine hydrolase